MSLIQKMYINSRECFEPFGFKFDDLNRCWKNGIYVVYININFNNKRKMSFFKKDLATGTRELIFEHISNFDIIKTYLRKEKIKTILKDE